MPVQGQRNEVLHSNEKVSKNRHRVFQLHDYRFSRVLLIPLLFLFINPAVNYRRSHDK